MPGTIKASFQTKLFLAALTSVVIALAVAGTLFSTAMRRQTDDRIEQTLIAEEWAAFDSHALLQLMGVSL